jgi:hypothetical protein
MGKRTGSSTTSFKRNLWSVSLSCPLNIRLSILCIQRYIDNIFFTSNQPIDIINQMLDEANSFHPNIKLVRQIGTSVSFLDVFIENKNSILATSVYRKDSTEPYIVPFKSDNPRHVF